MGQELSQKLETQSGKDLQGAPAEPQTSAGRRSHARHVEISTYEPGVIASDATKLPKPAKRDKGKRVVMKVPTPSPSTVSASPKNGLVELGSGGASAKRGKEKRVGMNGSTPRPSTSSKSAEVNELAESGSGAAGVRRKRLAMKPRPSTSRLAESGSGAASETGVMRRSKGPLPPPPPPPAATTKVPTAEVAAVHPVPETIPPGEPVPPVTQVESHENDSVHRSTSASSDTHDLSSGQMAVTPPAATTTDSAEEVAAVPSAPSKYSLREPVSPVPYMESHQNDSLNQSTSADIGTPDLCSDEEAVTPPAATTVAGPVADLRNADVKSTQAKSRPNLDGDDGQDIDTPVEDGAGRRLPYGNRGLWRVAGPYSDRLYGSKDSSSRARLLLPTAAGRMGDDAGRVYENHRPPCPYRERLTTAGREGRYFGPGGSSSQAAVTEKRFWHGPEETTGGYKRRRLEPAYPSTSYIVRPTATSGPILSGAASGVDAALAATWRRKLEHAYPSTSYIVRPSATSEPIFSGAASGPDAAVLGAAGPSVQTSPAQVQLDVGSNGSSASGLHDRAPMNPADTTAPFERRVTAHPLGPDVIDILRLRLGHIQRRSLDYSKQANDLITCFADTAEPFEWQIPAHPQGVPM
ncbi:hypothetical protein FA95DRAFT_1609484 [Auriscalpium vulgare]|uniref:Uncharacterized protein n=1 Tax=Auriscalpium vulgare TaxID=40419 RepID=A0ACB8RH39_9AGAM|nr:hypothetical protein FA95DRAFT_1609484 [Auriscalpium vulgare]